MPFRRRLLGPGILAACTIAPFINALFAFGEEFGWRGYLLPRLVTRLGTLRAIVAVGVIWGVWHAPLIVLDGLNFPTQRWAGIGLMIFFCTVMSVFLSALRLRSHSIWPATLAHGALNAEASIVALLLWPMEGFWNAPLGMAGALPFIIAGLWLFEWQCAPGASARVRPFRL